MARVCVITDGVSGIGLAAAKYIPREKIVVLASAAADALQKGVAELQALGYTAYAQVCNTSDRNSVKALVAFACSLGEVRNVIHAADAASGIEGSPEDILRNIIYSTVYVNEEFSKVMQSGVILDVSSNVAYAVPALLLPKKAYPLVETDQPLFMEKLFKRVSLWKDEEKQKRFARALAKHFVVWYAQKCAFDYAKKEIRVLSLSHGGIDAEKVENGDTIAFSVEGRSAKPQELGYALATLADERNGYLAGVDVLCDGGSTNGKKEFKKKK